MGMAMMGTAMASGEERAREAAEAAVASPLLEDISLAGAKGVLVNITAGMDMSIGEFEEVGEVIKGFTSDQATVVVGTVIDPEMKDDLRVTIVVTGLNAGRTQAQAGYTHTGTTRTHFEGYKRPVPQQPVQPQTRTHQVQQDSIREQQAPTGPVAASIDVAQDNDYLDIPTFLRRQAD
jgi:cell division protein FtsZ